MAQFDFSCALPLFPALFVFGRGKDLHDAVCQGGRSLLTMLIVLSCSSRECTRVIISCTCGMGVPSICGVPVILSGSVGFKGDSPTPHRYQTPQGQGVVLRKLFHHGNHVFHQSPHKHAQSPHHRLWHSKAQSVGYIPLCSLQSFQTERAIWEIVSVSSAKPLLGKQ